MSSSLRSSVILTGFPHERQSKSAVAAATKPTAVGKKQPIGILATTLNINQGRLEIGMQLTSITKIHHFPHDLC